MARGRILSALRVTGRPLAEPTLLFTGAGEAATGIADIAAAATVAGGMDERAARHRCWLFDSQGLVTAGRGELAEHEKPCAHGHTRVAGFADAVRALRPTAIIGGAATAGTFAEDLVREVSARIAAAVAAVAFDRGLATVPRPTDLLAHVRERMYEPVYADYVRSAR